VKAVEQLLPPFVWDLIYHSPIRKYGWFGNYSSWEEAEKNSQGYDSSLIVEKVKEATLAVKMGAAAYERDSVIFDKIQYDWPVIAGLMWVAAQYKGELNVIDFGGSLGSSYWQNRKLLSAIPSLRWNIIEQKKFVDCGKQFIEDDTIKFYYDFASCLNENKPNVVLLSSVLPYIRQPYELLSFITKYGIPFMIIDRLFTINSHKDRLTVQKVPPYIYEASYPAWFFSNERFLTFIKEYYDILEEYNCGLKLNLRSEVKGLILKLRK
jgi:putative methyltransferase (TIGR04325 family)